MCAIESSFYLRVSHTRKSSVKSKAGLPTLTITICAFPSNDSDIMHMKHLHGDKVRPEIASGSLLNSIITMPYLDRTPILGFKLEALDYKSLL